MSNFIPRLKFLRVITLVLSVALVVGWVSFRNFVDNTKAQSAPFKNFEAPQVHPLAMTPDGTRLLAVNIPNGTLSVFYSAGNALTLMAEIPVGLEPVSVVARNDNEAWVVDWLSDSISVMNLNRFKVSRSFDVGDERDLESGSERCGRSGKVLVAFAH